MNTEPAPLDAADEVRRLHDAGHFLSWETCDVLACRTTRALRAELETERAERDATKDGLARTLAYVTKLEARNTELEAALTMLVAAIDCSPIANDWHRAPEFVEARALLGGDITTGAAE